MIVLISYDIEDNRVRTKLAKRLKDFGPRVQKSVFEADVGNQEYKRLIASLQKTPLGESDSIRLYRICGDCAPKVRIWGCGELTRDKPFYNNLKT